MVASKGVGPNHIASVKRRKERGRILRKASVEPDQDAMNKQLVSIYDLARVLINTSATGELPPL